MKPSRYNYYLPYKSQTIFYNGLTEHFFKVKGEHADFYKTLVDYPDDNLDGETVSNFLDKLKSDGFILDDDTDEFELLREKYERLRRPYEYHLMILTTYDCNLRCWYCVQDHQKLVMDDALIDAIKAHVEKALKTEGIQIFFLNWFGGEPLLDYERLKDFTEFAKSLCEKNGIMFHSGITTNGTLLDKERIDALNAAGVTNYQITVDGPKKIHDKVKHCHEIESAFDKALENVDYLSRFADCTLRFNYTHKNLLVDELLADLENKLSPESRRRVHLSIYKVWQESQSLIDDSEVERLYKGAHRLALHPYLPQAGMCYADQKHFYCVFPNGKVGKCDNHSPGSVGGTMTPAGDIIWPEMQLHHKSVVDIPDCECIECRYLPLCWGPCVSKRKVMYSGNSKVECMYSDRDKDMAKLITSACINYESAEAYMEIENPSDK